jgi:hypothetical protein
VKLILLEKNLYFSTFKDAGFLALKEEEKRTKREVKLHH